MGSVALAVLLAGCGAVLWHQETGTCRRLDAVQGARLVDVIGSGPAVFVVGDSYAEGLDLDDPDRSWPAELASSANVQVHVDGASGSGFTTGTPCGRADYVARAASIDPAAPLVLQGGLNDVDASPEEVRAAACAIVTGRANVAVVGPPMAPAREPDAVRRIDAALHRATAECGGRYVSTLGWDLPYNDRGLHLTPDGHREFGRLVAVALHEEG